MRMNEKYLTLEQNTCAARIFLNIFGLTLENINNVNEFSKIKLFDKTKKEVGELHFNNDKIIILANYNNSVLEASYNIAKIFSFADIECGNALFGQWSSKIIFQIQKEDNIKLNGEFLLGCSIDSESGFSCFCHPFINCEIPDKRNITLKILRDGRTFGLESISENYIEKIDIMPTNKLGGFILHDIKKGKYNNEKHAYPYRKYTGIFNGAESGKNKDKLKVFLIEEEFHNRIAFHNELLPKVGKDNSTESIIQKGLLMQKLDPDMGKKIKELRNLLFIGDISLLDNLISVCYDHYTDEALNVLLGIKREKMDYQDGADSLKNSYFGINEKNYFFPLKSQKKLLKK